MVRVATKPKTVNILAIDPGFSNLGFAVLQCSRSTAEVIEMGVQVTTKSKIKIPVNEDNLSRNRELASAINAVIEDYNISMLTYESYSMPQMASKANLVKIGFPYGILATLSVVYQLPVVMRSPQAVKKAVCGRNNASKQDVEDELKRRFGEAEAIEVFGNECPRTRRNHAWDALGSFVAAEDSDVMRAIRR